jgi:hypothetical protein
VHACGALQAAMKCFVAVDELSRLTNIAVGALEEDLTHTLRPAGSD